MDLVTLENFSPDGHKLKAVFAPEKGMNLVSYEMSGISIIDERTMPLFEQRLAGLGALIGPHFHHRQESDIAHNFDPEIFPHIKTLKKDQKEPLSHGIARYVPWRYQATSTQIDAHLSGKDYYKDYKLKDIEGMDFEMHYHAMLLPDGLLIDYRVQSEKPSVIGLHYYYSLQDNATVEAFVDSQYRVGNDWVAIPENLYIQEKEKLKIPCQGSMDYGFISTYHENHPFHRINLKSEKQIVHVEYTASDEDESSWQLYHPEHESFVCIEPLSAKNPRKPQLKSSHLQVKISAFNLN